MRDRLRQHSARNALSILHVVDLVVSTGRLGLFCISRSIAVVMSWMGG